MRLLLFDIDGTLVDCGGQARPVFAGVLQEVFGRAGAWRTYDFSGKTDGRIVLDLVTGAGVPEDEALAALPRVREIYVERLERSLDRNDMRLLPGLPDLLEDLATREGVHLGLLTGNWEAGARTKLSRFDLNRFFAFGAYGCDAVDRNDLPPVAIERAERHLGHRFRPEEVLIIGDSPADVSCARAHGIPVLAVATGWTSAEDLRAAGADRVIDDLRAAAWGCFPGAYPPIPSSGLNGLAA